MDDKSKRLLIIDSNSVIHRAYHALPPLTTEKGELTNAVYGFLLVFLRAIKDFRPDYIAAAFDFPAPTFRHKKFKEYKAQRPPTPKELSLQIPKIKEVLKAFNVPVFEKEGFEADDILATIARKSEIPVCAEEALAGRRNSKSETKKRLETIIISGDLDTLQLVDKNTKVYHLRKGVKDILLYDESLVKEKFQGLTPEQILDFKALKGDPSDNIPGVAGIGEKTAIKLIKEFGSLENLYSALNQQSPHQELDRGFISINQSLEAKLKEQKEQAFLSRFLAQINKKVPLDFNLERCRFEKYDKEKVVQIFKELEFNSLIKRLSELEKEKIKKTETRENLTLL